MRFYEFGKENSITFMLLPGTKCHWKNNFGHVIPLLEKDYHVICVSYDGFDETEETVYPDTLTETERIEGFIKEYLNRQVDIVYNETVIQESLSNLIREKTVLIIAHRMRTIVSADKVVVLKEGVVAE